MKNFSSQKERIIQFIEYKGISKNKFYIETGISNGILDKKSGLSMETVEKLYSRYPEINAEWLLTGEGAMLKSPVSDQKTTVNESRERYDGQGIPLLAETSIGDFGNPKFSIPEESIIDYYVIPKFRHKKIDFLVEVEGSSMYPKFHSGDIVACTIISENSFIQWNKSHVIATEKQGIMIKRIKKASDDNKLCMISENKEDDCFEILKEEIKGIALIVGFLRLE